MRAVLLSVRPHYCELIANGKKTIELRKSEPKLKTPFKCYIYCTFTKGVCVINGQLRNGYIIGEFICDYISRLAPIGGLVYSSEYTQSCLSAKEIKKYAGNKQLYGWHISKLKIYDKPKKLSEFYKKKPCGAYNLIKGVCDLPTPCVETPNDLCIGAGLTRPPQSWCYVET